MVKLVRPPADCYLFFDIGCLNNISTIRQRGVYTADFFESWNIKLQFLYL